MRLADPARPQCGAITFVQRFGGALNLNVHFHSLVLDGVHDPGDGLRFRPLPPPSDGEVERVAHRVGILLQGRLLGIRRIADTPDLEAWFLSLT